MNDAPLHSLNDFRRHAREYAVQMKRTGEPRILTLNGRPEFVVQSLNVYRALLAEVDRLQTIIGVRAGLDSIARGESRPAREALEEIRRKHRIPN
jgi:PHD/YefM family antitoxin component YafN of YafNO toxin-antitoxin module